MSLRSSINMKLPSPGFSPGEALALSPFDKAQGRRWMGDRYFRSKHDQMRLFLDPPLAGEGRVRDVIHELTLLTEDEDS